MKNWKEDYDLLTAFALGEATPEMSRKLEKQMETDPELRAEVEEIRRMSDFLTNALAHEPFPENVEYPGVVILPPPEKAPKKRWSWLTRVTVSACALVLVVSGGLLFWPEKYTNQTAYLLGPAVCPEPAYRDQMFEKRSELNERQAEYEDGFEVKCLEMEQDVQHKSFSRKFIGEQPLGIIGSTVEAVQEGVSHLTAPFRKKSVEEQKTVVADLPADGYDVEEEEVEAKPENAKAPTLALEAPAAEPSVKAEMASAAAVIPQAEKARALGGAMRNGFAARQQVEIPRPEPPVRPLPPGPPTPPTPPAPVPQPETPLDRNSYAMLEEQKFQKPEETPFSTFGVDVDSASYTLMRQYITERNTVPPKESVRVEEYINYFTYDLKGPAEDSDCPFETTVEIQKHPWRDGLYMAMVALKGREIPEEKRPKLNLVFLLDVSGSMSDWNKLPLVKDGMMKLLDQLKPEDRVSIVTYASGTEIKLEPTPGTEKRKIEKAILELNAYGSTNGGEGLQKAYELAKKNFGKDAENRVILCSDGDFNVGMTNNSELQTLVETEAKSGVFLTVLGFGMGNFQDDRMKALASHGNGVYGYVDSRAEAKKMLCDELSGSLVTIAKDVKLQIEFNPAKVAAYRLIGYETRHLEAKDFHDDRKDSGELGAGHSVVALYELVPVGGEIPQVERVDEPRYAPKEPEPEVKKEEVKPVNDSPEWFFVKLRWKKPDATESTLKTFPVEFHEEPVSANFQWATGTALYAMLLRESAYTGTAKFASVLEMIQPAVGDSDQRKEFVELVKKADAWNH